MAADDEVIRGVVNMDAIAYDGNGDTKARVHVRPVANSMAIGDTVFAVLDRYNIDIDLLLTNPGAIYSDHASFWTAGYGAVLIIEEFGADGNPQYHTPNDRVEYFDVPYFEKLAKLSIGTFATLAVPFDPTASIHSISGMANALYLYPNPTSDQAVMWVELESDSQVAVHLLNALGQELDLLYQGPLTQGKRAFNIPLATYPPGTYSVVLTYSDGRQQARLAWSEPRDHFFEKRNDVLVPVRFCQTKEVIPSRQFGHGNAKDIRIRKVWIGDHSTIHPDDLGADDVSACNIRLQLVRGW